MDARANTKVRTKAIIHEKEEVDVTVVDDADDATDDDDDKLVVKSVRKKRNRDARWSQNGRKTNSRLEDQMPTFLDPSLWHKYIVYLLLPLQLNSVQFKRFLNGRTGGKMMNNSGFGLNHVVQMANQRNLSLLCPAEKQCAAE